MKKLSVAPLRVFFLIFPIFLLLTALCGLLHAQSSQVISVSSAGTLGNAFSILSHISGNGRYVVFYSGATNLVAGSANSNFDIFLRDLKTGTTSLISSAANGAQGNGDSQLPFISRTGRYVGFGSVATNLVPGRTNTISACFIVDRALNTIEQIDPPGNTPYGCLDSLKTRPVITVSEDGRYAAFQGSSNGAALGVYLHDRKRNETIRITQNSAGLPVFGWRPVISADGNAVVFSSESTELSPEYTGNLGRQIFLYDVKSETISLVSKNSNGEPANDPCEHPSISDDGKMVLFDSAATNLIENDTNGQIDVFLYNRSNGAMSRVSKTVQGTQTSGGMSGFPWISGNGRFAAYFTRAAIAPGFSGSQFNSVLYDIKNDTTTVLGTTFGGFEANGDSRYPIVDNVGRFVTFSSTSSNLDTIDTNGSTDVYLDKNMPCDTFQDANNNGVPDCLDPARSTRPETPTFGVKQKRKAVMLMQDFEGAVTYLAQSKCRTKRNGSVKFKLRNQSSSESSLLMKRLRGTCRLTYRVRQESVTTKKSKRIKGKF